MKRIFILALISICINSTFAQKNSYVVLYESTKNIGEKLEQIPPAFREQVKAQLAVPEFFELTITENESFYKKVDKKVSESDPMLTSNVKISITEKGVSSSNIFIVLGKTPKYVKEAVVLGKSFLISDDLKKINWELTDETKKIGNHTVRKAMSGEGEYYIEAWYAPELPFPYGPDKYWGLPGLIIELKTNVFYYIATEIQKTDIKKITPPTQGKKVTEEELEKIISSNKED